MYILLTLRFFLWNQHHIIFLSHLSYHLKLAQPNKNEHLLQRALTLLRVLSQNRKETKFCLLLLASHYYWFGLNLPFLYCYSFWRKICWNVSQLYVVLLLSLFSLMYALFLLQFSFYLRRCTLCEWTHVLTYSRIEDSPHQKI